jgi:hypothetical protein
MYDESFALLLCAILKGKNIAPHNASQHDIRSLIFIMEVKEKVLKSCFVHKFFTFLITNSFSGGWGKCENL